ITGGVQIEDMLFHETADALIFPALPNTSFGFTVNSLRRRNGAQRRKRDRVNSGHWNAFC
ncbi:MAG: hypothetical protein ABFD89_01090, partial [Bryobacteraceae bacterium]